MNLKCYIAFLFYTGELLFYPIFIAIFYIIIFDIVCFIMVIRGIFLALIIFTFFPFILCYKKCSEKPIKEDKIGPISIKALLSLYLGLGFISISPFLGIYYFFKIYYLIFKGKISPYFTFEKNWKTMTSFLKEIKKLIADFM